MMWTSSKSSIGWVRAMSKSKRDIDRSPLLPGFAGGEGGKRLEPCEVFPPPHPGPLPPQSRVGEGDRIEAIQIRLPKFLNGKPSDSLGVVRGRAKVIRR